MFIFGVVVGVVAFGAANYFFPVTVASVNAFIARQFQKSV